MASGPLDGTRVLEFTQIVAGPLGCQLLSDLGAEVIKVEPVNGEAWRFAGAFLPAESKWFHSLNRGKKSLAMNIADPQAQEAVHRLVRDVDVVVINYRPDVAARLGIDYETLAVLNPALIYVDNTAFGREGAFAARPGYDIVVQALCGLIATGGKLNEDGVPVSGQPPIADTTTGYAIAVAVCAALFYRLKTGRGQKIETSLMINALLVNNVHFASLPAADADDRARFAAVLDEADENGALYSDLLAANEARSALNQPANIYYRCFLTSDGAIAIGALSADLRVKQVLEVEHNRDDPGYDLQDPAQRQSDIALAKHVEAKIRAQSSDYWEQRFEAGGVPVSKVNFPQTLIDHPQVLANGYAIEVDHDLSGPERLAAPPWKMSESPPQAQGASPPLGRDNDAILTSVGYAASEIEALRAKGVIR